MVSNELQKNSSTTSNKLLSCIILLTLIIGHIPQVMIQTNMMLM